MYVIPQICLRVSIWASHLKSAALSLGAELSLILRRMKHYLLIGVSKTAALSPWALLRTYGALSCDVLKL